MNLRPYIEKFSRRYNEVEAALSDPKLAANTVNPAKTSGYCRTDAAKPAGSRVRIVLAHRSSCRHSAASVRSGTVVATTVPASATSRPSALTRRPNTWSSAR